MNPFKYGCVVDGEHFCPRPQLERQLQEFAASGQNLVIQGARRMGKTSLIKHALGGMRKMRLVYIDLYCIASLSDFCARVMRGISKASEDMSYLQKAMQFAFRLRPVIAIDPRDGTASISVDTRAAAEPESLEAILSTLEKISKGGKTCVVFDEFQDILKLKNSNGLLAQMRSMIQFQDKVPYFFTGSDRNDMMSIFDNMDSPFYKSALTFAVNEIAEPDFSAFISKRFASGKRKISPLVIAKIIAIADGVSGDVQQFCEALWETTDIGTEIGADHFDAAFDLIASREMRGYDAIIERLTPAQSKILRLLAEIPHAKVFSAAFATKAELATSTIRRVLNRLCDDRIIFQRNGEYRFSNPFFREWLRRQGY